MNWPLPIRVAGVGSPQGDDAVAWAVLRRLRERLGARTDIELHELDGGQRLLDVLDGRGTLVLVDALAGEEPGTIHRLEWPDRRVHRMRPGSTHNLCPAEALELAATLGTLPPRVVVFGIEADCFDVGEGLSHALASSVPEAVHQLLKELANETTEQGGK